ncbi:MAG: methyltransferase domain-containing protein [Gammaproteobacteria bacterium]|nr:methyltransferase domain-containing protein [Gammaproteobacteria bacterium]
MKTTRNIAVEVALHWRSGQITHTDRRYFEKLSLWRDFFPVDLGERLRDAPVGAVFSVDVTAGELVPAYDRALVQQLKRSQFRESPRPGLRVVPRKGRWYPATFFDTSLFFRGDTRPGRILSVDDQHIAVDFNHPLAAFPMRVEAAVAVDYGAGPERGGRCNDIVQEITARGPGMQAPLQDGEVDFLSGEPFARMDPRDDMQFYGAPRLVQHLDAQARARITDIYARFLQPGMRVLDLMSSWTSHLPEAPGDLHVTGLGMNAEELAQNPRLSERVVRDLNREAGLPFATASFDAVLCTASVEYLIHPIEVFKEVARVLKPGAPFVLSFSDRWFPPKAIELWSELHPFERLGLVLQYFQSAGAYGDLGTESLQGLPRPEDGC